MSLENTKLHSYYTDFHKEYIKCKNAYTFKQFLYSKKIVGYQDEILQMKNDFLSHSDFLNDSDKNVRLLSKILQIDLNKSHEIKFKKIIFNLDQRDSYKEELIIKSCLYSTRLLKNKYKKIFEKYTLCFNSEYSRITPKEKMIFINYEENKEILKITSDFLHEIGHAIEYEFFNNKKDKEILEKNINYLKTRITNKIILKNPEKVIYSSSFNDMYVGTIWIDPFHSFLNLPYTEISSYGLGYILYNPIEFILEDYDYFLYIGKNFIS